MPNSKLFPSAASSFVPSPVEHNLDYYTKCAMAGALSCGITHTMITPLDLVKVRLQVDPEKYKNIFNGFKVTYREGGASRLTLGWAPTLFGYSMQGLCKFGFYELFKDKFSDLVGEEAAIKYRTGVYLAASACAEIIADVALCPMEAVKVRIQTKPDFATNMREGLPKILSQEGVGGLFKGVTPLWLRQVPYTMMKFAAFQRTVESIYKYGLGGEKEDYGSGAQLGVSFAGGYIAGIFCAVVSHPADTVVSKLNEVKTEGGTGAAIMKISKDLGPMGMWRGLFARILMIGTLTGLQWLIYDSVKVWVGLPTTGGKVKEISEVKEEKEQEQ
eukprot:gb/GECH01011375.1/.p1 GENE.gb/GECH01011375.1/~~gb/GECH01011375.1/.p1  ORF type:complete len:330 (+),score=58.61 gb/GECH01011375.1/:1-990(+)